MLSRLMISDGRSQTQRQQTALSGDYFHLNEMRFEQLLALASDYARMVRFFHLDLKTDGDWHGFFLADETVLLASILVIDVDHLSKQFEQRLARTPDYSSWIQTDLTHRFDISNHANLDSPLLLIGLLNYWLDSTRTTPGAAGQELKQLLESIVRGLGIEVSEFLKINVDAELFLKEGFVSTRFRELCAWPSHARRSSLEQKASQGGLRHNFHAFAQAIRMAQGGARRLLPDSLLSGEHDPAVSLLITFIQLFQKLQVRLNRFGEKHLDFYYHRVLRMQQQKQHEDSAYLVIRPAPGARQMVIEAGDQFIAGVDAHQQEILYYATENKTLNDAQVVAIHTLYFEKKRHKNGELQAQTCHLQSINMLTDGSDEREHEKLPPHPLMGAPKPNEKILATQDARFGFSIASKVLFMKEGERHVRVLLQYRSAPEHTIEACLERLASTLVPKAERQHGADIAIYMSDAFVKLMRGMFRISLTSNEGWYQVEEYRPEYNGLNAQIPSDCLSIEFTLPPSVAPIVAHQIDLHGNDCVSLLPLLRFEMTQNEFSYPYELLKNWILHDIQIDVTVQACRQLLLHNQIGQLSALAPFAPFGPLPSVGSYLIVGCEELLCKHLIDVELEIEWGSLPNNLGGLPAHYRAYQEPLKSSAIMGDSAVLVDGKWIKSNHPISLFEHVTDSYGSQSNQVANHSVWSYRSAVPFHKPEVNHLKQKSRGEFAYTPSTTNGLFKMTLEAPSGAFGHQEYPNLLSQILTYNSRQKKPFLMKELPNQPYTPQINSIFLNYRARTVINFDQGMNLDQGLDQEKLIHLHPMGSETIVPINFKNIPQIPQYDASGNLFIGLKAQQLQGTLSLYFYLREDSLPMTKIHNTGLSWWYLTSNRWKRLSAAQILDDSTFGFMTSGIVQLNLPGDLDTNNSILPAGIFWLRVSAEQGMERFCSLYSIYAQAIRVRWAADHGQKPHANLPSMQINRSKRNIPGIASILQIRRSFDGKLAENALQFRTRASERLRHKNRALTASDYEMLILERFPEIYKVKCFANLCTAQEIKKRIRPGHILIVPLPALHRGGHFNQKPTLSGHLIHEVEQYVRELAPPYATISVENPVYEEVQVRCHVKLKPGLQGGWYSEQINQALCDFLSPWNVHGQNRHFGWNIRQHDIIAYLLDIDFIDEISGVSLLQISPVGNDSDLLFSMTDNARNKDESRDMHPAYPWSIAVPMNQHWIVVQERYKTEKVKPIGISELKIGSTFIIAPRETP
jgi:hypothetical protein